MGTSNYDSKQSGNTAPQNGQSDQLAQNVGAFDPKVTAAVGLDGDIHGTNFSHSHATFVGAEVKYGHIHYSLPFTNWYRVALEAPGGVLPCVKLMGDTGAQIIGPRDTSLLPPDSPVFVITHPSGLFGYIIGVVPRQTDNANFSFPDWLVQGGNVGLHKDAHHNQMLSLLSDEGGVRDFSAGRPIDQLSFDWGRMTETGVGIHIDPAMFFLRIDELCGIYGYQQDQLLRISGYNLDEWSAAHTVEIRDDEGEATYFRGETPYPWEMLGSFKFDEDVHKEITDEDVVHKKPQAKFEPIEDHQEPFYRYREYGGYLGQGRIREILIPPDNHASDLYKLAELDSVPQAVFRESVSLDGTYALQSAKAVILAKKTLIPAPKKIRLVEDYSTDGDSAENDNYKFAGQHGTADDHEVGDLVIDPNFTSPALVTAAAVMELHAYTFNWKAVHAFHYHAGDYEFKDYSDIADAAPPFIPAFDELRYNKMWLDRPTSETAYVDHRYKDVEYFPVSSHVTLAEDGAVIIQGGQGEEIRMVGGSIQISCPGDILLQPGKSVIALAGDDAIIRARKSVDITATENDVRLKAENNLQMLAANSGDGSLLIESRSTATKQHYPPTGGEEIRGAGIILKAKDGQIATLSHELYLRTGIAGGYSNGQICLDASAGKGKIRTVASSQYRFLESSAVDTFTSSGRDEWRVNRFSASDTILGSRLRILGELHARGGGIFMGTVKATGHFKSNQGGHVDKLIPGEVRKIIQELSEEHDVLSEQLQEDWDTYIDKAFYEDGKTGEKDTQLSMSFSMRSIDDYGSAGFVLPQTHWQTLNEVVKAGEVWEENDVDYGDYGPRQPWPGKEMWEADETFLRMEPSAFKMHDLENNRPKDRTEEGYSAKEYGDFTKSSPNKHYKVLSDK